MLMTKYMWRCAAVPLVALCACAAPGEAVSPDTHAEASAPVPEAKYEVAPTAENSAAQPDFLLTGKARQGGYMLGVAPAGTQSLTFDGVSVPLDEKGRFFIAFDRDAGTSAALKATLADGTAITRDIAVVPGQWRLEHINANYTGRASSAEFKRRRASELAQIRAARAVNAQSDGWRQDFIWPLTGRISGLFGAQRVYRGKPGSYHGGTDVAAPSGTKFVAPADGVVVLAAQTPFTLEGHLLIVDHGMGLNSAFLHCSSLAVNEGDVVKQGQVLGTVGATGRVTGPHLHWGIKWNAARLDPLALAGAMEKR